MATIYEVDCPNRKPLFEGVQGENEARSIQFDITPWVDELGDGAVTATAKRPQDSQPYPVTVTKDGTTVTWKPTSTDTAYEGVGLFQLEYTVGGVIAKTCIWSTQIAPSLDPAGDPPEPYYNYLAEMRQVAAEALQHAQDAEQAVEDAQDEVENAEAWAVGQRGGVDVPSTDPTYENNAKYYAEQSLANQYSAFIVKSASGDIASFSDGADDIPMKSLKVAIVPKQAGSGDPSPSNVRPITGTSTANVTVTGKNMFDSARFLDAANWTESGGVYTGDSDRIASNRGAGLPYLFKFSNPATGQYSISFDATSNQTYRTGYVIFKYSDGTQSAAGEIVGNTWTHYSGTSTAGKTVTEVAFLGSNSTMLSIKNFQLEVGSAATSYEPYTGTTTPVSLGQTVYGGEVDVATGVMTIDSILITLDGTEDSWVKYGAQTVYNGQLAINTLSLTGSSIIGISSHVPTLEDGHINGNYIVHVNPGRGLQFNNVVDYYGLADNEVATWKAFLASQYANGTPFQILVHPVTPTIVQLTPAQVATLLGTNNVWADCGSVEVEYRADPTLAYNELANVIVSLGGNI